MHKKVRKGNESKRNEVSTQKGEVGDKHLGKGGETE